LKSLRVDNMRFNDYDVVFKRASDTALPLDFLDHGTDWGEYRIQAYEGPDMKDHVSSLEERVVVLTTEYRLALRREILGETQDSEAESEEDEDEDEEDSDEEDEDEDES
jgi:hypothetical protein